MPFRYRHIVLSAAISLLSTSCLLSQEDGYFSLTEDTLITTRHNAPVQLRRGEIYKCRGPLGFWRNDTFKLSETAFSPIDAQKKIALTAKANSLTISFKPIQQEKGNDSVKISLKLLLLEKTDTAYLVSDEGISPFIVLPGKKDTIIPGNKLPSKFRLSAPGWPVFFFERDSVFKPSAQLSAKLQRDSAIEAQDSIKYVQNYLNEREQITLWPPDEFSLGILFIVLLIGLAMGWKLLPKLLKSKNPLEKTVTELREKIEQLEPDLIHFKSLLDTANNNVRDKNNVISTLIEEKQSLARQLEEIRPQVPFRLPGYRSFLETAGNVDAQFDKHISEVENEVETLLQDAGSEEAKMLYAVFHKYRNSLKLHLEAKERWKAALRTMADGDGLIVEKEILKTLNNVEGTEALSEELRRMFFIQWMEHKVSATFILLEELRVLSSLTDQPSETSSKLSGKMETLINNLLAVVRQGLGCNAVYVRLFSPIKDEFRNVNATRVAQAKSWYLNHRLDEKERETILEIERYATDSLYVSKGEDKQTSVLVKGN